MSGKRLRNAIFDRSRSLPTGVEQRARGIIIIETEELPAGGAACG